MRRFGLMLDDDPGRVGALTGPVHGYASGRSPMSRSTGGGYRYRYGAWPAGWGYPRRRFVSRCPGLLDRYLRRTRRLTGQPLLAVAADARTAPSLPVILVSAFAYGATFMWCHRYAAETGRVLCAAATLIAARPAQQPGPPASDVPNRQRDRIYGAYTAMSHAEP